MITNVTIAEKCGGPSVTLLDDGRIHVGGLGEISRAWSKKVDAWRELITRAASRWDIPEAWIAGVMLQESGGTQGALSPVGAVGLMQIMPSTPAQVFGEHPTREELYDPETNIGYGARLLALLARKTNWNPVAVFASYNAGGMYCYSGKNCDHAGLWNVNENCGYCEQVVRGVNAAIANGYSGTGATESESTSIGWKVLAALVAFAVPVGALVALGYMPVPTFAKRNPYTSTWRDFISGEWWLTLDGESEYADQDVGDVAGHAAQALDAMIDRDVLVEGLIARGLLSEDAAEYLETSSQVVNELERKIPAELGAEAVHEPPIKTRVGWGREYVWRDAVSDPEVTYMRRWGAIRVAGRVFQTYHVTDASIRAMQDFLLERFAEGGDVAPDKSKIEIEQVEPRAYAELPIAEFLTIKHPRELWG